MKEGTPGVGTSSTTCPCPLCALGPAGRLLAGSPVFSPDRSTAADELRPWGVRALDPALPFRKPTPSSPGQRPRVSPGASPLCHTSGTQLPPSRAAWGASGASGPARPPTLSLWLSCKWKTRQNKKSPKRGRGQGSRLGGWAGEGLRVLGMGTHRRRREQNRPAPRRGGPCQRATAGLPVVLSEAELAEAEADPTLRPGGRPTGPRSASSPKLCRARPPARDPRRESAVAVRRQWALILTGPAEPATGQSSKGVRREQLFIGTGLRGFDLPAVRE